MLFKCLKINRRPELCGIPPVLVRADVQHEMRMICIYASEPTWSWKCVWCESCLKASISIRRQTGALTSILMSRSGAGVCVLPASQRLTCGQKRGGGTDGGAGGGRMLTFQPRARSLHTRNTQS